MGSHRWVVLAGLIACSGDTSPTDTTTSTGDTGTKTPPDQNTYDMVDTDRDGFMAGEDCNDLDPFTYPGAPELCGDGVDQDCDGDVIARNALTWYPRGREGRDAPFDLVIPLIENGEFEVDGGEIVMCGGVVNLGTAVLRVDDTVEFVSTVGDASDAVLSGEFEFVFGSEVTVSDITFGGEGTNVIYAEGDLLELNRVVFDGADVTESVVATDNVETVTFDNVTFTDNTAGAGLINIDGEDVSLRQVSMGFSRDAKGKPVAAPNTAGAASLLDGGDRLAISGMAAMGDSAGLTFLSDVLSVDTVSISGMTGTGPALTLLDPEGSISNLTVDGNAGGGVLVDRQSPAPLPSVILTGLTASNNFGYGLTVATKLDQTVNVPNATFSGNGSAKGGGGLHVNGPTATVVASGAVISDGSGTEGGAVWIQDGIVTLDGMSVTNNAPTGSVVQIDGGTVSMVNASFTGNGGDRSVELNGGDTTITGLNVSGDAGGVLVAGGATAVSNVTITQLTGTGPAFEAIDTEATFSNLLLDGNAGDGFRLVRATDAGAKVAPIALVSQLTSTNNAGHGMALDAAFPQSVDLSFANINGNGAKTVNGGGVSVTGSDAVITATACAIDDNTGANGGGMYVSGGSVLMNGGTMLRNSAVSGGAAYIDVVGKLGGLTLSDVDLGELKDDNTPDDIFAATAATAHNYGASAETVCNDLGCTDPVPPPVP